MEAFDRIRGASHASAARGSWLHPFAQWSDDPHHSPPALVARLRPNAATHDPLRVATVSAVHRVLEHAAVPHVLPLRTVARDVDGGLVLSYRRVDATDLGTVLGRGSMPHPRAFAILRQVCRALAAAHAVGIDHRVLGPASVLLEPQAAGTDRVWIADFGIAQLFESDDDTRALALHPTTPERVFGGASETSEDVYLVGCLAFWLFTGAPPFVADDLATLQRRHAIEDAKRVSELTPGGVPAGLDEVVARALEKDPEERWPDVEALDAEIEHIQRSLGIATACDDLPRPQRATALPANARPAPVSRGSTTFLRPTTVLPAIDPTEPSTHQLAPARVRRSMPLILTSIGFSIGLVVLGFVDAPPEPIDDNQLAPARIAPVAHEGARDCERVRKAATDARAAYDWVGVLRLTDERGCWPSEPARVKLRVKALLELRRFAACVEEGKDANDDPEIARWIAICRERMEPSP